MVPPAAKERDFSPQEATYDDGPSNLPESHFLRAVRRDESRAPSPAAESRSLQENVGFAPRPSMDPDVVGTFSLHPMEERASVRRFLQSARLPFLINLQPAPPARYTLNLKRRTSPSLTTYSLPSIR